MAARIISADAHVQSPGDLWVKEMPAKYRDRAPRLLSDEKGDYWWVEGLPRAYAGLGAGGGAGLNRANLPAVQRMDIMRPGSWDPEARLADMAMDGIDGQFLYPNTGLGFYAMQDADLIYACFEVYNTWVADWIKLAPGRFQAVGCICLDDAGRATAELQRCRELGLAGALIPVSPGVPGVYADKAYDRFWGTAQEQGTPLSVHVATARGALNVQSQRPRTPVEILLSSTAPQQAIGEMILARLFDRFPKLKVVSAEFDAGWLAYFMQRMDEMWHENPGRVHHQLKFDRKPSEYVRRNVWATFMDDEVAVHCRELIGVDRLMWSDDYPHIDGVWSRSREVFARNFPPGTPEAHRDMILGGNYINLYGPLG